MCTKINYHYQTSHESNLFKSKFKHLLESQNKTSTLHFLTPITFPYQTNASNISSL